jgi:hypothetical protein
MNRYEDRRSAHGRNNDESLKRMLTIHTHTIANCFSIERKVAQTRYIPTIRYVPRHANASRARPTHPPRPSPHFAPRLKSRAQRNELAEATKERAQSQVAQAMLDMRSKGGLT